MITDFTNKILDKLGLFWEDLAYDKVNKVAYGDLIYSLIAYSSIKDSSSILGISERTLERILPLSLGKLCDKDSSNSTAWKFILLELIDIRTCYECKQYKCWSKDFDYMSRKACKECSARRRKTDRLLRPEIYKQRAHKHYTDNKYYYIFKSSSRKKLLARATPKWADVEKINNMYNNCPEGYHIDHTIPLQGEFVCGLHVENNLQYLTINDNLSKGNKFQLI
jgi:hypothetical protein